MSETLGMGPCAVGTAETGAPCEGTGVRCSKESCGSCCYRAEQVLAGAGPLLRDADHCVDPRAYCADQQAVYVDLRAYCADLEAFHADWDDQVTCLVVLDDQETCHAEQDDQAAC